MSFVHLAEFPSILHLVPWSKVSSGDSLAPASVLDSLIGKQVVVEEKVDGTNVGMTVKNGQVVIRNRNRILNESHKTRATFQYGPLWNWCYDRLDTLTRVCEDGKYAIYGEWCYICNTVVYDLLPEYFIAFDLYDLEQGLWLDIEQRAEQLRPAQIEIAGLVWRGKAGRSFEADLGGWIEQKSFYSRSDHREGVMVRPLEGPHAGQRFKVVRPDYQGGLHWSPTHPRVQGCAKGFSSDRNQ